MIDDVGFIDITDAVSAQNVRQLIQGSSVVAVDKVGIILAGYIGSAVAHNRNPEKGFLYYMQKMNENLLDGKR